MSKISWIKISTDIFNDEKIRLIECTPNGDSVLVIFLKILTQAGKCNQRGYIMLSENIPMNIEVMATLFNKSIQDVRHAIQTLQQFGLIEVSEDEVIYVTNWEKHQNIEGMEKVRLQNAERNKRYRERKKQEQLQISDVSVTSHDGLDIDKEIEKEKDINKDKQGELLPKENINKEIIEYLNLKANRKYLVNAKVCNRLINKLLDTGYKKEDFFKVIDVKVDHWLGNGDRDRLLRPQTLFAESNFEEYLTQTPYRLINKDKQETVHPVPIKKIDNPIDLYNTGE